jgi:hypothetical protein
MVPTKLVFMLKPRTNNHRDDVDQIQQAIISTAEQFPSVRPDGRDALHVVLVQADNTYVVNLSVVCLTHADIAPFSGAVLRALRTSGFEDV